MTTTIGTGQQKLADWGMGLLWPCEECKGRRSGFGDEISVIRPSENIKVTGVMFGECACTLSPWLAHILDSPADEQRWLVYGDWLEDQGNGRIVGQVDEPRGNTPQGQTIGVLTPITERDLAALVGRLMPLDKFPEERIGSPPFWWWWSSAATSVPEYLRAPGPWTDGIKKNFPSALAALVALDTAIQSIPLADALTERERS